MTRLRLPVTHEADSIWVMNALSALAGAALILIVLIEGFETVVLPHIVFRRVRLTRFFYRGTWKAWSLMVCGAFAPGRRREIFLSLYGPLTDLSSVFHCPPGTS